MKKNLVGILLILVFAFPWQTFAQDEGGGGGFGISGLEIGLNASGILSTIAVDYSNFYKLKPGFSTGLFVKYSIADPIAVSLGLNYSQRGAKKIDPTLVYYANSPIISDNRMDFIFNSIEVPLLAHIYINPGSDMLMKVIIGGATDFSQKAYTLSYNTTKPEGMKSLPYKTVDDISPRIKGVSFSGILGFGVEIPADPVIISTDLSYRMGFKNMNNVKGNPYFYNNFLALSISAAYKF